MLKQAKNIFQAEVLAGLSLSALGIFILLRALARQYTGDFGSVLAFYRFGWEQRKRISSRRHSNELPILRRAGCRGRIRG
jgi:hypothetical protein